MLQTIKRAVQRVWKLDWNLLKLANAHVDSALQAEAGSLVLCFAESQSWQVGNDA